MVAIFWLELRTTIHINHSKIYTFLEQIGSEKEHNSGPKSMKILRHAHLKWFTLKLLLYSAWICYARRNYFHHFQTLNWGWTFLFLGAPCCHRRSCPEFRIQFFWIIQIRPHGSTFLTLFLHFSHHPPDFTHSPHWNSFLCYQVHNCEHVTLEAPHNKPPLNEPHPWFKKSVR